MKSKLQYREQALYKANNSIRLLLLQWAALCP